VTVPTAAGINTTNLVTANNYFGYSVFGQLIDTSNDNNIFISPTSIAMALSMIYGGAEGSTQTAMQTVLNYNDLTSSKVASDSHSLLTSLEGPGTGVNLDIANSLWIDKDFSASPTYLNNTESYYNAKAATLNFAGPSAATTINNWASTATKGNIPTIVQSSSLSQDLMLLANAVYFKGDWTFPFQSSMTTKRVFTTASGSNVKVPTMEQQTEASDSSFNYYSAPGIQAIQLPYGSNARFNMNVYMPSNMSSYLRSLTFSKLSTINSDLSNSNGQQGTILLPRFSLNYTKNLNPVLQTLGMGIAFGQNANFNGIAPGLNISEVDHASFLSVYEAGTTAAAVTAVGVTDSSLSLSSDKPFYMDVNKPFIITIQDSNTGDILFMGLINNPSSS
jgi:serpin B